MKKIQLVIIAAMLLCVGMVSAVDLHVGEGQQYSTINDAYDDSQDGDTIIIHPGIYIDNIYYIYNDIAIVGSTSNPSDVILESSYYGHPVFRFRTGSVSRVENLTFRNSYNGINVTNASLDVHNCIFNGNEYAGLGGTEFSEVSVSNSSFINNGWYGAHLDEPPPLRTSTVENCYVSGNGFLPGPDYGSGIKIGGGEIRNCTIINNKRGVSSAWTGDFPPIINSIVFNNQIQQLSVHITDVTYSCIQGGFAGEGNISDDPILTDGVPYLKIGSPCIGSGSGGGDMGWCSFANGSEIKNFHEKWNWVSFPRMPRLFDDVYDAETIIEGLEPYAIRVYGKGELDNSMLWVYPPGNWNHTNLWDFQSSLGYKVDMDNQNTSYDLNCYGEILSPHTPVTLQAGTENWIGYFHTNKAKAETAFAEVWDNIKSIKTEHWAMWRYNPGDPIISVSFPNPYQHKGLYYGEMAVVEIFGANDIQFRWNSFSGENVTVPPSSSGFTFDKKADYVPIMVYLEEGTSAEEVGVFVDDECKGFGKVVDDEAIVLAYVIDEARSGDLGFVLYNGEREALQNIERYTTYNPRTENYLSESIHLDALRKNYVVSFRGEPIEEQPPLEKSTLSNYPNPFNPDTTISYNVPMATDVALQIFNAKGQLVKTLVTGKQEQGNYNVTWSGKDNNGKSVSSGIYYSRLKAAGKVLNKKMVLMK